jgi:NAD(P)-dependent dehydrogenase (short-subunit alcohol dehydrogenase family)
VTGSLSNRIALITGASRGIGAAVAKRYAAEGAELILVARDIKGLEETDDAIRATGGQATLVRMDLTESDKIEALAQQVAQRFGKLDILVGNAAILGELSPMPHQPPEVWENVLATNVAANFHLMRCFDTLLKQSDAPRVLFVSSDVADAPFAYWGAYAVSKAALDMMVEIYAAENVKTTMKINLINPGEVRTRMNAQAYPGLDPLTRPAAETITDLFVKLALPGLTETGKKFHVR